MLRFLMKLQKDLLLYLRLEKPGNYYRIENHGFLALNGL
jgi:hypothetical protein